MKVFILSSLAGVCAASGASLFINEFHYENDGLDQNEFVEIAVIGSINPADYTVSTYNGGDNRELTSVSLASYTLSAMMDTVTGSGEIVTFYTFDYTASGDTLQNGPRDGIALSGPNGLIEFLSYEGVLTAADGPAAGVTSIDVGVQERDTAAFTPLSSIARVGTGDSAGDFTFVLDSASTAGGTNNGQTFLVTSVPEPASTVILGLLGAVSLAFRRR